LGCDAKEGAVGERVGWSGDELEIMIEPEAMVMELRGGCTRVVGLVAVWRGLGAPPCPAISRSTWRTRLPQPSLSAVVVEPAAEREL